MLQHLYTMTIQEYVTNLIFWTLTSTPASLARTNKQLIHHAHKQLTSLLLASVLPRKDRSVPKLATSSTTGAEEGSLIESTISRIPLGEISEISGVKNIAERSNSWSGRIGTSATQIGHLWPARYTTCPVYSKQGRQRYGVWEWHCRDMTSLQ